MWQCTKCGERHEDQYDSCWKCNAPRQDIGPPTESEMLGEPTPAPNASPDEPKPEPALPAQPAEPVANIQEESVVCPKCGADKMIPSARLIDEDENSPMLQVYVKPAAMFFREAVYSSFHVRICGECGYTELWADEPAKLYAAYLQSRQT